MAEPYITLDGISSVTKGLRLVELTPFFFPARTYTRENVYGRISSIRQAEPVYGQGRWKITVAMEGEDKPDIVESIQALVPWMLNATRFASWHSPTKYYTGRIEGAPDFSMLSRRNGQLKFEFVCDPPCYNIARSIQAGWAPAYGLVADQIDNTNETCSAALTAAGALPSVTYAAFHPAALYFKITGTWTSLTIGGAVGMVLAWPAATEKTIYIDCDNQQVYYYSGGDMVSLMSYFSGDFPVLSTTGAMAVSGTSLNVIVRMLAIERG